MLPYMVNKDVYNKWELCGAFCSTPITWIRQRHWSVCSVGYLVLMHRTPDSVVDAAAVASFYFHAFAGHHRTTRATAWPAVQTLPSDINPLHAF